MIVAVVTFDVGAGRSVEEMSRIFEGTAPKYLKLAGLLRKDYLYDPQAGTAGGVYLWESRAAAERVYDEAWRQHVRKTYRCDPEVRYFESPVEVDNATGRITRR